MHEFLEFTIIGLVWTGMQIFQEQDDPVGDRLGGTRVRRCGRRSVQ